MLGLEADQLVHIDEPGAPATLAQLTTLLPQLVPDRLDDLLATGVVEDCGPDRYCVPSPSILQLTVDWLDAGLSADAVLTLLTSFRTAADTASTAVLDALAQMPAEVDNSTLNGIVTRGRGLLAHGVGRLTIHRLGRNADAADHATEPEIITRLRTLTRSHRTSSRR